MSTPEHQLENQLIEKLTGLKYEYRPDIPGRISLEKNFREKFESLNQVHLTDGEFQRILEDIITPDVFTAARTLRERSDFVRDDGTPLTYTLVNIRDWCKNTYEVVNQLRINTDNSHHRYDVILLINGVPVVQIEFKTLGISPRRAMEQIVEYKNDPGNGYAKTLLSFIQLFIVSNRSETWYFANNNARHFAFNADERFLPIYQFAPKDLDRQTREEFNKFQEGCVEENTNTGALVRRLLSDDYADKVIVATIQKLGLALDENSRRNKQRKKNDQPTYKEQLASLRDKRMVFIFDECHRSLFGENHRAIKEFFPLSQLFGFTGTPIFDENATAQKIEDRQASMKSTDDLFQKKLHAYTITHAIEDGNVLRFHVDFFKPEKKILPKPGEALSETAVREGYTRFKTEKDIKELAAIASKHGLAAAARQAFVDGILSRMIFDGEQLSDLMAPLELGWKARTQAELALMDDLLPLLIKRAEGRDISGLSAYEQ